MPAIALLGFPNELAAQLGNALAADEQTVYRKQCVWELGYGVPPSVVFLCGDAADYRQSLRELRSQAPLTPVVVATRLPDSRRWLEALEAGAADFCGAPFEPTQVAWILDSVLGRRVRRAA